jgi:hypothetical protein
MKYNDKKSYDVRTCMPCAMYHFISSSSRKVEVEVASSKRRGEEKIIGIKSTAGRMLLLKF